MARLRRMELAHQEELAQLHLRIGQLQVAAQRGPATQRLAQVETLGIESQMSILGQAANPPPRSTVLQLGPVASSRVLLQEHEESTDGTCSTDDLMAVQVDPVAAVMRLMETNKECALCLIPCGAAANTLGCAVRCIKQARPLSPPG